MDFLEFSKNTQKNSVMEPRFITVGKRRILELSQTTIMEFFCENN